jgi:hypothetical protein
MLSGFILNVTVISVLVNVFITLGSAQSSDVLKFFLVIGAFFIVVFILKRLKVFERLFRGVVERVTNRLIYGSGFNIVEVLENVGKNSIAQVQVLHVPEVLVDKTLEISDIRKTYMVNVLAIIRGGETNANVTKDDVILTDDKVIVFGKIHNIKKLFIKEIATEASKKPQS